MSANENKPVAILGVPLAYGATMAGVDMGPAALRVARLQRRIERLGYPVRDLGDLRLKRPQSVPLAGDKLKYIREISDAWEQLVQEVEAIQRLGYAGGDLEMRLERLKAVPLTEDRLKYVHEISSACDHLAQEVEAILEAGEMPLILGGDHSIAIGSFAGAASYFKQRDQKLGLIWFDAHADMNTPETTPSGNIHGMPLAALLGFGTPELTNIAGFAPKLDPLLCAHIGARDIDPGEKELIRLLGIRFFTMREIDERGMAVCMDEAIRIASRGGTAGYAVTFDVDVLDPGDAPGSGTLVRGGLTYREAHLGMEKIAEAGGMRSLEIVEINTALDVNNKTAELGVELILSALGKTIL